MCIRDSVYIMCQDLILILDLGSEENSRLARQIRDLGVYSEIREHDITKEELLSLKNLKGIILNGGENRVVDGVEIKESKYVFEVNAPFFVINHNSDFAKTDMDKLPCCCLLYTSRCV